MKIATIIDKLKDIKNPVTGTVICIVTATLSTIVIVCIVALAFGHLAENLITPIVAVMTTGTSFLFSGFLVLSKSASGATREAFIPVSKKDFGSHDF